MQYLFACLQGLPAELDYSITSVHPAGVVSGTEVNLAVNKPAYQSSVDHGLDASKAVGTFHMYLKGIDHFTFITCHINISRRK